MSSLKLVTDVIYSLLPNIYRVEDAKINYPLKRFIDVLVSGGIQNLEEKILFFTDLFDVDKCPSEYLPYLASFLGFEFPHDLDLRSQRKFLKYIPQFYKIKGTKKALEFIIRELLSVDVEIINIDGVNRSFDVSCIPNSEDPTLEQKQSKVVQLVESYKPANSTASVYFSYWFKEECTLGIEDNLIDIMFVTLSLNRKNSFTLNKKGYSTLNKVVQESSYEVF